MTLLSGDPNFWNNQKEARETLEEIAHLTEELDALEMLELRLLETKGTEELDESSLDKIEKGLNSLELSAILSTPYDKGNAIVSFFAGAGGRDAEDWTGMLLSTYQRFCESKGWKITLLHEQYGPEGGLKEATMEVKGASAYGLLKGEAGVHRLVRISPFSSKQLRHTSFALIEILPEASAQINAVEIKESDLRTDTFRSSGPGGQNVNRRESAVRITHVPTGVSAASQSQRSQLQNRAKALELVKMKLRALLQKEQKENIDALQEKVKPHWGNQARSYVLDPYSLVKDHRTGIETHDVEGVLAGNLQAFIEAGIFHQQ